MTEMLFTPTVVPPLVERAGEDATPPTTAPEHSCEICGADVQYKGRGRIPKRCPEHRKTQSASVPKSKGSNATLAATAADALCQWNGLLVVGCMVAGYHGTGSAIAERETAFREQAYAALVTDPALCRVILRAGTTSAKLSLLMAYGMLGIAVAPVAMTEFKEKKAIKEAEQEAAA